jgi:trypsin-like peptidase
VLAFGIAIIVWALIWSETFQRWGQFHRGATEWLRIMLRLALYLTYAVLTVSTSAPVRAQDPDDELRIYAAGILNVAPFARPFSGYGVYLGQNAIITAAHVVGHWPILSDPTVSIAGTEISAKVIKKGAFPQLDLALLVAADAALPVNLQLRQNPLCKQTPPVGASVIVVSPERTERSQIISPQIIPARYRSYFGALINEPHGSGSGVFDAESKCLLGIMSAAVMKDYDFRTAPARPYLGLQWDKSAGYFVPASAIASFIPAHLRF